MTKDDAKALVMGAFDANFTEGQKESWNERDAQGMPLLEGEVYHVKTISADTFAVGTIGGTGENAGQKYLQIPTVEGTMLGISQIARKGNGLGLDGVKRTDLIADFISKVNTYCEDEKHANGYAIKVLKLKTRPGQNGQMVIPTFAIANT